MCGGDNSPPILDCGVMVARRILVPQVQVRILTVQQNKINILNGNNILYYNKIIRFKKVNNRGIRSRVYNQSSRKR